ncbi:TraB/GumN family protein [Aliirhizobium smilacinae]|uniref:Polysaccharide biosynthesis protein GumN n=1 Tax=Aliirhizobium smilacinae TaxID=1395944 RepID=A0A5C4XBM4_9HYPH|nr:TraB/GumN family protein [Rhizobium smilacinae]TNM60808.1 polysaccharide biosynthesis protein GumN [Rhizobium smilacinae]
MNSSFLDSPLFERLQGFALWLIASLHVALLGSLILALGMLSSASAQEVACNGVNLVDEMKSENPEAYAKAVAEAATVPNTKGIFWKIEKPGLPTSYLLGTMHVTDPRVLKMPAGANEALAGAKTIVIESDEVLDDQKAMAGILTRPELTMLTDGNTIEKLLKPDDLATLEAGLKKRGVPLAAVSRMQPWMLMSLVSLPACEMARKGNTAFLDKRIALDAAAEGKAVKGLETLAEQLSAMASIPTEMHLKSLVETIKLGSKMDDVFETMTQLYLTGEIGFTMPFLKQVAPDGGDNAGYAEFEELIVTKRNHLMAERAAPILNEGNVFIAVGALHLPGKDGLVELLRKQGFTVTPAG